MSKFDHLGSSELETLKQSLRAQRRQLEPVVGQFTRKRQSGTGGTMQRVPSFHTLTSRQAQVLAEYNRLGDEAMQIQQIQSLRKEERQRLYAEEKRNGFNYYEQFTRLARQKLSASDLEEIEDLLAAIADAGVERVAKRDRDSGR